jgi:hypothetical protein
MNTSLDWLACHGDKWQEAVVTAASILLQDYRTTWPDAPFVNLYRLASTLDTRIAFVTDLTDGARLMPVQGGFRVLVRESLPRAKFRFSVAHELAHTLFYSREHDIPQQLQGPTKNEEIFCCDVARRVLAPDWLVDRCGLREMASAKEVFATLTDSDGAFRLSKPLAARVMLADYRLAKGVGGLWLNTGGAWKLKAGMAYASQSLGDKQKKLLRGMAQFWLKNRKEPLGFQVIGCDEVEGDSAFVIVLQR